MYPGQTVSLVRTFSQAEFDRFAALSGDDNPIHVDPAFAARTRFGRTVAHGMFLYSHLCALLGSELPGPGTLQLEQEMIFPSATHTSEEVELRLEVIGVDAESGSADLQTTVIRPGGEVGLQGRTRVSFPDADPDPAANPSNPTKPAKLAVPAPTGSEAATLGRLALGQRARATRIFTRADLEEYVDLIGDANPVYGLGEGAGKPLWVPGGLLAGMFSDLLGTRLPGRGTNWLKQRLLYPAPAHVGEHLTAVVEITRLRPEKHLVNLRTVCTNPQGAPVCEGEALVYVKDLEA